MLLLTAKHQCIKVRGNNNGLNLKTPC
jgi:hypothetical protein